MYKGFLIKQKEGLLGAENLATGIVLNPIYDSWEKLKMIIDNLKEMPC